MRPNIDKQKYFKASPWLVFSVMSGDISYGFRSSLSLVTLNIGAALMIKTAMFRSQAISLLL